MARSKALADRSVPGAGPGRAVVTGIVLAAAALAVFAVWFQWRQTRRCLAFYGVAAARGIQAAPRAELWTLAVDPATRRLVATDRRDITAARGLVHLRRGLVEDANFAWGPPGSAALPPDAWDEAIAFFPEGDQSPVAVVAFDLDGAGWATVVGRPGRVSLGRLRAGLRTWVEATRAAPR